MRLTRRDALSSLGAAGASTTALAGCSAPGGGGDGGRGAGGGGPVDSFDGATVDCLVAAAEVLYPDEVEGVRPFVERFVEGRAERRPDHAAGVRDAVEYLDAYTAAYNDVDAFAALGPQRRDEMLRAMRADTADSEPTGSDAERVRHFVVEELLFALYASPSGGRLVGTENPPGSPGGLSSYRASAGRSGDGTEGGPR